MEHGKMCLSIQGLNWVLIEMIHKWSTLFLFILYQKEILVL